MMAHPKKGARFSHGLPATEHGRIPVGEIPVLPGTSSQASHTKVKNNKHAQHSIA